MENLKLVLEDAEERLKKHEYLNNLKVDHLEDRFFSIIYEISGVNNNGLIQYYILKVGTTGRSCKNEYEMYRYLASKEIKCLTPVIYSDKHSYLITRKENLTDLATILRSNNNVQFRAAYFARLGKLLKEIYMKTEKESIFNKKVFCDYVIPRLMKSRCFSKKKKIFTKNTIEQLSSRLSNSEIRNSFVTDLSLGNIHLNNKDEFVLVDMGDAEQGNSCQNVVDMFLVIKFGALNQYYENKRNTKLYYDKFSEAYGTHNISKTEFILYEVKQLINMINFIAEQNSRSRNVVKKALPKISDKYLIVRYRMYMLNRLRGYDK